jgi:hypothetical protein
MQLGLLGHGFSGFISVIPMDIYNFYKEVEIFNQNAAYALLLAQI